MYNPTTLLALLLTISATTTALSVNPTTGAILRTRHFEDSITNLKCSGTTKIDEHDMNVAVLSICGGIAKPKTQCEGNPKSTTGASGTAKFQLDATAAGSTINISKGRWEHCVDAARE
ncbi:hypothetical protein HYALB_00000157 [Hymenoscyphus albidus]|uniref:Uncharacterized protein n=1 Tax=Hymenoscyphus albidus TaxID=595503 RepID=A0A9N9Q343_9HELO|nr:hypothetical protein HYALB_00000157 [Hymenoscyphus albidus]